MRKRSRRTIRNTSHILAPNQHTDLMILPHMALHRLIAGQGNVDDMESIIGLLNIASAMAYQTQNVPFQKTVHQGLDVCKRIVERCTDTSPTLEPGEQAVLTGAVNAVDKYLGLAPRERIVRAVSYVYKELEKLAASPP